MTRSDDGGQTFSSPVPVTTGAKDAASRAYLTVGADGSVYVFSGQVTTPVPFGSTNPPAAPNLYLSTSRDNAKTFTQQAIFTDPPGKPGDSFGTLLGIAASVDRKDGNLYVTWEDTGQPPPAILFMRSTNRGVTWTKPAKVNDVDPQTSWTFNDEDPMLSVAPNGRIDIAWYDWRGDPSLGSGPMAMNNIDNVYYSSSSDSGATWTANVRISDRSIDRRLSDVWSTGIQSAVGLVAMDKGAYVAWDDTRNAVTNTNTQDVYFTRVHPVGKLLIGTPPSRVHTSTKIGYLIGGLALGLELAGIGLFAASRSRRFTMT